MTDETGGSRSPAEDLAMIRQLMEQSQRIVQGAAGHYIAWGLLVTVGLLVTYGYVVGALSLSPMWIWGGTVAAGWAFSFWYGKRSDARRPVGSPAGRIMAGLWIGCGVAMTILGFVGPVTGALDPSAMLAALACVMGTGYFASGALQERSWPRAVAAGWWAGAIALFVWPGVHALLVMAGLMVAFHLVPGLVIYRAGQGDSRGVRRSEIPA